MVEKLDTGEKDLRDVASKDKRELQINLYFEQEK